MHAVVVFDLETLLLGTLLGAFSIHFVAASTLGEQVLVIVLRQLHGFLFSRFQVRKDVIMN